MSEVRLIRSAQVADAVDAGEWPLWFGEAHAEFVQRVMGSRGEYPCHFGTAGERGGLNAFTVIDDDAQNAVAALAERLRAYREIAWSGPPRQSLVVFVGPPDETPDGETHTRRFWEILEGLSAHDAAPWPDGRTQDPADPAWQWCFAGEPWFVFAASPSYERRRSRDLGPCLTLVFQVQRVFEGLSGSTPAGQSAKQQVRGRLRVYDAVPPHPHLGDELASSRFKWRQYVLPDDDDVLDESACPFHAPVTS